MDCAKIYRVDSGCRALFADSASQLVRVQNVFRPPVAKMYERGQNFPVVSIRKWIIITHS